MLLGHAVKLACRFENLHKVINWHQIYYSGKNHACTSYCC
jgi:hypothetical protein